MNIIFAGTPDFSLPSLKALMECEHQICAVYTQPDRPAGRGRKLKISPIKQYAIENNLPVEQPVNFKSENSLDTLQRYNADLMVVVAYGIILPTTVLSTPTLGCINIHASILPRWRGAAPIQRALLAGDIETGVTLMQMDEGLDTGNVLAKSKCSIEQDDTSKTLHDKLSLLGANALIGLLPEVQHQRLIPTAQLPSEATYAQKLTKQEAKINWGLPATDVLRAINGYNPWPVAHTLLGEAPLRIWSAKMTQQPVSQESGHIKSDNNQMLVACQDNYLEITELQPVNKRRMTAREYLAAHTINNLSLT